MIIKASRITNLTDARYFAAKNVDFLGFNLEGGTEGFLDPIYMKAIREWVQGPAIVGEFSRSPVSVIREADTFYGLDAVQVTEQYLPELDALEGIPVLVLINSAANPAAVKALLGPVAGQFRYAVVELNAPLSQILAEKAGWQALCREFPLLFDLEITAGELPAFLAAVEPQGLSMAGGAEEKVGFKSFDAIEEWFDAL